MNGRIYLLVSLKADSERTFTVRPGQPAAAERQVRVSEDGDLLTFDSGVIGGAADKWQADYATPVEVAQIPGPLRGVRTADGAWIGKKLAAGVAESHRLSDHGDGARTVIRRSAG